MFDVARLSELTEAAGAVTMGADEQLSRSERRDKGAFFTPMSLVELVVSTTLEPLVRALPRGRVPPLVVLDPACGDGRFLDAASRFLAGRLGLGGAALGEIRARCTLGIEREPSFAALASQRVPESRILCAEALTGVSSVGRVDAVVGNPPYMRSIHLGQSDQPLRARLRGRLAATSHGEWDLYAAFLEQSLDWLHSQGQVGLVVPSRWLTARWATRLRQRLASRRALRGLIDFGAAQVFASATTYASVTFLSAAPVERAQVARWRDGGWVCGAVDASGLTERPWDLSVGAPARRIRALEVGRSRLADVADIVKGAGTNADPVFAFAPAPSNADTTKVFSRALGEEVALESRALRPCFRGRDVGAVFEPQVPGLALVPYASDGQLWSAAELKGLPRTREYLLRCRDKLEARERGRFAGEEFYRYGRPQNMRRLASAQARVLVPDVAKGGRAAMGSSFALDSVYAIFPREARHLEAIAAIVASPVTLWWLGERGVLLRGGYVRMKTAFLRELPIPDLDSLGCALRRGIDWREAVEAAYATV